MTHDDIVQLCAVLATVGAGVQLVGLWLYPAAVGAIKSPRKRKIKRKRGARLRLACALIDTGGIVMFLALTRYCIADISPGAWWVACVVLSPFLAVSSGVLWLGSRGRHEYPGGAVALLPYAVAVIFNAIPLLAITGYERIGIALILANWMVVIRAEIIKLGPANAR